MTATATTTTVEEQALHKALINGVENLCKASGLNFVKLKELRCLHTKFNESKHLIDNDKNLIETLWDIKLIGGEHAPVKEVAAENFIDIHVYSKEGQVEYNKFLSFGCCESFLLKDMAVATLEEHDEGTFEYLAPGTSDYFIKNGIGKTKPYLQAINSNMATKGTENALCRGEKLLLIAVASLLSDSIKIGDYGYQIYAVAQIKNYSCALNELVKQLALFKPIIELPMAQFLAKTYIQRSADETSQLLKQAQMLKLLLQPLDNLTEALENMQADTQQLRATLYEPSRGIFSAAPRVSQYFENGGTVGSGSLTWDTEHDWGTCKDLHRLRKTLAALIIEIFGKSVPWPDTEGQLIKRAAECILDGDEAFNELRQQVCAVTRHDKISDLVQTLVEIQKEPKKYTKAITTTKEILHRPFKEGGFKDITIAPLLLILDHFQKKAPSVLTINGVDYTSDTWWKKNAHPVSPEKNLLMPVPRFSYWLQMINKFLSYIYNEKNNCIKKFIINNDSNSWSCSIVINTEIPFFSNVSNELYREMEELTGKNAVFRYVGNFKKPFFDFVTKINGKAESGNSYEVKHREYNHDGKEFDCTTTISISKDNFYYHTSANAAVKTTGE